jgi:hypothetical protein
VDGRFIAGRFIVDHDHISGIAARRMFPFMTVIMLAGLMRIPSELFEAAAVNSAHTASLTSRKPLSCRW